MNSPSRHSSLPTRSLRLMLRYSGTQVQLEAIDRLAMIPPPDEELATVEGRAGSWVELRDADQRMLYQQMLYDPIPFDVEVAEDAESGKLRRQPINRPGGIIELVVPDLPETETLRLYVSLPGTFSEPAVELLRLALNNTKMDREEEA